MTVYNDLSKNVDDLLKNDELNIKKQTNELQKFLN